jgi:hypothetical protein
VSDDSTSEPYRPLGIVGECPGCESRVYSHDLDGVCGHCGCEQPKFIEPVEPIAARALLVEPDVPLPEPQTRAERCADLAGWYGYQALRMASFVGADGELISEVRLAIRYALDALGRDDRAVAA